LEKWLATVAIGVGTMDDWYILDRKSTSDIEYEVECMERRNRGQVISPKWKKGGEELIIKVNLATREVVVTISPYMAKVWDAIETERKRKEKAQAIYQEYLGLNT
jgi:hypothetical protein